MFKQALENTKQPSNCSNFIVTTSNVKYLIQNIFTDTITTFEAVWGHWQQLLRPIRKVELADLSVTILKQITPFLVAENTAKLYISWQERQYQFQQKVTKETILDVVQQFQVHPHLQLTEK